MKKKQKKKTNVIAYLATNGNMYSAPVKEKKQLKYIKEYAQAHNINIVKVMNKDIACNRDVITHFERMAAYIKAGKADGVIVANLYSIAETIPDAYYKVGLIAESKGDFICVDLGKLSLIPEEV